MKNNFTKEDIKNSVEYGWRKTSFCWLLGIWADKNVVHIVLLTYFLYDIELIHLTIV